MAVRAFQNRSVFDDDRDSAVDVQIQLDRAIVLEELQRWKSVQALTDLQPCVARFRDHAHAAQSLVHVHDQYEDILECSAAYLLNELDQISAAQTIARAHYYIDRLIKGVSEIRTGLINDINLNRWKEYGDIYTDSLWMISRRDGSGVHTAGYWGNFIPQIPNQMMRRYTRRGEWVLDTFAGSGTTLIEGQRLGRHTLGIELQPAMVERVRGLIASEPNRHQVVSDVVEADSAAVAYAPILERHGVTAVQLVVMHPPYFDIIKFSDHPGDLSNASSIDRFLAMMGQVIENAASVLERGRYLVLVIGDKYMKGDWIPLGFQTMNEVLQRGFSLKSIIVKNFEETAAKRQQQELWRYRALVGGFYIFKHEYIFLFKKQ